MKIRFRFGFDGNHNKNYDEKCSNNNNKRMTMTMQLFLFWMIVIAISAVNIIQSTTVIVVDGTETDTTATTDIMINPKTKRRRNATSANMMPTTKKTDQDELILNISTTATVTSSSSSSSTTTTTTTTTKRSLSSFPKVFGIGLKKTGTSTLDRIFRHISSIIVNDVLLLMEQQKQKPKYPLVAPPYGRRINFRNDTKSWIVREYSDKHHYFQDDPWFLPQVYKYVAVRHPTSKFILTTRNTSKWYDSVYRYVYCPTKSNLKQSRFGLTKLEWYRELFNAKSTSKQDMIEAYEQHTRDVRQYFLLLQQEDNNNNNQSYNNRLLEIDLTDPTQVSGGKGWKAICEFLELPLDKCPTSKQIPHTNETPKQCHNITPPSEMK